MSFGWDKRNCPLYTAVHIKKASVEWDPLCLFRRQWTPHKLRYSLESFLVFPLEHFPVEWEHLLTPRVQKKYICSYIPHNNYHLTTECRRKRLQDLLPSIAVQVVIYTAIKQSLFFLSPPRKTRQTRTLPSLKLKKRRDCSQTSSNPTLNGWQWGRLCVIWVECDTRHGQMDSVRSRDIMGLGMIHVHDHSLWNKRFRSN